MTRSLLTKNLSRYLIKSIRMIGSIFLNKIVMLCRSLELKNDSIIWLKSMAPKICVFCRKRWALFYKENRLDHILETFAKNWDYRMKTPNSFKQYPKDHINRKVIEVSHFRLKINLCLVMISQSAIRSRIHWCRYMRKIWRKNSR